MAWNLYHREQQRPQSHFDEPIHLDSSVLLAEFHMCKRKSTMTNALDAIIVIPR